MPILFIFTTTKWSVRHVESYNMVGSLSRTLNNMSMWLWELVEQMTLNGQNMVVLDLWDFIIATHILTIYTNSFSTMG